MDICEVNFENNSLLFFYSLRINKKRKLVFKGNYFS